MKKISISVKLSVGLLVVAFLCVACEPKLSNEARKKFTSQKEVDSLLSPERNFGNVNLLKLKQLLVRGGVDTTIDVQRKNDSIYFSIAASKHYRMYLGVGDGQHEGEKWIEKYKNLPISIVPGKHISAKLVKKNGKEYVYIPYEMLSCVVSSIGDSPNSEWAVKAKENAKENKSGITFLDTNDIRKKAVGGQKIQVEGYVLKNVSDILSSCNCVTGDQACQMRSLYEYAHSHWIYVFDPAQSEDTWRSASETIENYYFTSNHMYTGDCDDFAILMASFARQIGYKSRFVAEWGSGGGHAHAEYSADGSNWYSLDWDGSACKPISQRKPAFKYSRAYYDL